MKYLLNYWGQGNLMVYFDYVKLGINSKQKGNGQNADSPHFLKKGNTETQKKTTAAYLLYLKLLRGCPRGVMVKAMDSGFVVSEFVLQSRYYVHFHTLGNGMNPLILPAMG